MKLLSLSLCFHVFNCYVLVLVPGTTAMCHHRHSLTVPNHYDISAKLLTSAAAATDEIKVGSFYCKYSSNVRRNKVLCI